MTEYNYDHLDKLEWANRHIQAFDDTVRVLNEGGPYKAVVNLNAKAGQYVMRLQQRRNIYLNPSMMIGDALHSLHSSLDTVTYAVADGYCIDHRIPLTDRQRYRIQFPIHDKPEWFDRDWNDNLFFLGDKARTVFEDLQPYQRFNSTPESDPLSILRHLSNIDKHRQILVTILGVAFSRISFADGGLPDGSRATAYRGSLKHGAIIDSWPIALGRDYRKVNVDAPLKAHVEFSGGTRVDGEDVQRILWSIRNTITYTVFPKVEERFGS